MYCGYLQTKIDQLFDWGSRINVAASIAQALAFMHEALCNDGITHGNLKSATFCSTETRTPVLTV